MTWYAVHALIALRKEDASSPIPVYENIFLVEAENVSKAKNIGTAFAMQEVSVEDELLVSGVPAKRDFLGIRKIVNVSNPEHMDLDQDRPVSGTEITYFEYEVDSNESLEKMVNGEPVWLRCVD